MSSKCPKGSDDSVEIDLDANGRPDIILNHEGEIFVKVSFLCKGLGALVALFIGWTTL